MLSVVIPTRNCACALVPTLATLVPGVMANVVREVIVADGGSTDATREVVDFAGCAMIESDAPLGLRLGEAATAARAEWLMFLHPGAVLDSGWHTEVLRFVEIAAAGPRDRQAAVFRRSADAFGPRPLLTEVIALLGSLVKAPSPEQGLIVSRPLYRHVGGHRDEVTPEVGLIRRIGARRITRLRSGIALATQT